MSSAQRFTYALEPMLATRRWTLETLQGQLAEANQAVRAQQVQVDRLNACKCAASAHWQALTMDQDVMGADQFLRMHAFGSDIDAQLASARHLADTLTRQRDDLAMEVVAAQQAVEALEDHREQAFTTYIRALQSRDFRAADDQWISLSLRSEKDAD